MSHAAPHEAIETVFLEPEAVLYDDRTKSVVRLNPSATAVWLLLDGATAPADIAAELAEIVGLPVDVLLPDVEAAIAEFDTQHLLAGDGDDVPDATVPHSDDQYPLVLARPPDP